MTTEFYLSYDLDNEQLMYFKNINATIAPASLTKLMTSLILIENYNLSDYIEISLPSDYIYEGKVAYLKSGQKMTIESLLEFILIYSANDACFAVASLFSKDTDDFINLMNNRAQQLGMNNTNFKNINESIAPASLTKLMTSLILIENYNLSDYIEISLRSDYLYNYLLKLHKDSLYQ